MDIAKINGFQVIEEALKRVSSGNLAEAPFPLDESESRIWLSASSSAYQHSLEMMADYNSLISERDALRAQLETTQRELTATTISWENALAELDRLSRQEPVGFVFLDEGAKGCNLKAGIDILGETKVKPGDKLYFAPVPAMPMQDDRIAKEWQEIWSPIDQLVRPLTPLGHSVAVKAVELIKQALAIPIPKQEPEWVRNLLQSAMNCGDDYKGYFTLKPDEVIYLINRHAPSPRITEQELKVIKNELMIAEKNLTDGFGDLSPNCYRRIIKICRALLNKLNANTVAEIKGDAS